MRIFLALAVVLIAVFFPFQKEALAVPCTQIPSVQASMLVDLNNIFSGHLNAHVRGQMPPRGFSQANRSLFASDQDWNAAYNLLANQPNPLECHPQANERASAGRSIDITNSGINTGYCSAANDNGQCTAFSPQNYQFVRFAMYVVKPGDNTPGCSNICWVLYSAYPANSP